MSVWQLDKILHQVQNKAGWDAFISDADERLAGCDLTERERRALLDGDVKTLYQLGVNGYFLLRYGVWHGIVGPRFTQLLNSPELPPSVGAAAASDRD